MNGYLAPSPEILRIVILKSDRLYGDLIRREVWDVWPDAAVQVFQRGFDALSAIQEAEIHLFITGVIIEDMDGLEHLEPFIETDLPVLVLTSRGDERTFAMLRGLRYDGIYDASSEGLDYLATALRMVMQRRLYVSPSIASQLRPPKNVTLDSLTEKEQLVFSVIGDGSDDIQAADRLGMSKQTVGTHRKAIMRKLKLHHKGDLMKAALQHGYVLVTSSGVYYPGFQRRLQREPAEKKIPAAKEREPVVAA